MLDVPQFVLWISLFIGAAAVMMVTQWKLGRGSGLVAAYSLELVVLHWLAATLYLFPNYSNLDPETVLAGLKESTYGFLGFACGAMTATLWSYTHSVQFPRDPDGPYFADTSRIRLYLAIGIGSYFVLGPMLGNVATVSAVVSAASGFVVIALALGCWNAAHRPGRWDLILWLGFVGSLPFVTIAAQGFMGYGLAAAAVVFAFVGSFYRATWRTAVVALLAGYLGLSLYVTYMRDRNDIREVVWSGSSVSDRAQQVQNTFMDFEFFDPNNVNHLYRIDMRLNQNFLVGAAVEHMRTHEQFANGSTVTDAVLALIPRALWPDKPFIAGSGNLVSQYTGIRFSEGTSVGIGQVLEWYINFGSTGVFFGFLGWGLVLTAIDRRAARCRNAGEWASFACWFLPGVAMLQVGGSLVEVTSSAAAAALVANIAKRFTDPPRRAVRRAPTPHFESTLLEEQS